MKLYEILTQNRPKYMKLPEIWTPYTNRGGGGGGGGEASAFPAPPPPPTPMVDILC